MALPKKIKNFNLFVEGEGYAGRVTECVLPKLARKFEEYRAGGMDGAVDLDMGQEKLEGEFTLAEYSRAVLAKYGVTTVDGVQLRFRAVAQSDGVSGADAPEVVMRGRFKEIDFGTAKPGDDVPMKVSYSLSYYKYILNGEDLIEIDLVNMVHKVNGEDLLEEHRNALGL